MMKSYVKSYFVDKAFRKQLADLGFVEDKRTGVWEAVEEKYKYLSIRIIPKRRLNGESKFDTLMRNYDVKLQNNANEIKTNFHFRILGAIANMPAYTKVEIKHNFWVKFDNGKIIEVDRDFADEYIEREATAEFRNKYVEEDMYNHEVNLRTCNDFDFNYELQNPDDTDLIDEMLEFCYDKLDSRDEDFIKYFERFYDVKLDENTYWLETQAGDKYIYY